MKAFIDFDCDEADCGATVQFDLLDIANNDNKVGWP